MTIHLFCNEHYGAAFADAAARAARERAIDVAIVLSGKPRRSEIGAGWLRRLTRPWRDRARRRSVSHRLGLDVRIVARVNAPRFLATLRPGDHAVIAGFNQIFKPEAIARFATFVNFHPALLPHYRGPVPSYWCLKHRETHSGYTLHRVTPEIDAGEILFQEIVPVGGARHPRDLDRRISERAIACFDRWLRHLEDGEPWQVTTVHARSVYRRPIDYQSFPSLR